MFHALQSKTSNIDTQLLYLTDPTLIPEIIGSSTVEEHIERILSKKLAQKVHSSQLDDISVLLENNVAMPDLEILDFAFDFLDTIDGFEMDSPKDLSKDSIKTQKHLQPPKVVPQKRTVPAEKNPEKSSDFMTAREKFVVDSVRLKRPVGLTRTSSFESDATKKKFVSPLLSNKKEEPTNRSKAPTDPKLKNVDPVMVETIMNEVMSQSHTIEWDDIAGLEHAKDSIREIVVWPMLRPDIFTGIRGPPKGLLLFGPPGTGKTLIGKCIASQCKATFFSISSSILTSKWVGDGEKMVKALFAVARAHQPSVIFIDEIDSLLTQRTEGEVEATRRIKTEFLVQFDGCGTSEEDRILMIGATNRPQEIDEAARRRFRKKLYIPLPEAIGRKTIMMNLLGKQMHCLSDEEVLDIVDKTDGYSGSDMDGLVREAALGPIRDIRDISKIDAADVRAVTHGDFIKALSQVRASVSKQDLDLYLKFEKSFGSLSL